MTFEESLSQGPASGRLSDGPPLLFLGRTIFQLLDCSLPVLKGSFWVRDFPGGHRELSTEPLLLEKTVLNPQQGGACRAGDIFLASWW